MPSRKADLLTLGSRDTVHRYFLSVAIILCNKMDFSFGVNMAGFCRVSHIYGLSFSSTLVKLAIANMVAVKSHIHLI